MNDHRMNHHAWIDRKRGLLWLRFIGYCGFADVDKLREKCIDLTEKDVVKSAAVDISGIECFPDQEVRSRFGQMIGELGIKKVAVISGRPQIKVVSVILCNDLKGFTECRAFVRKENALRWLKKSADKKLKASNLQTGIA